MRVLAFFFRCYFLIACWVWGGVQGLAAQSTIFWSEDSSNLEGLSVREDGVFRQWRSALLGLTQEANITQAWRRLDIDSRDHVGIKVSTTGGRLAGTRLELVNAVIASLKSAGITRITIWDKWRREMEVAGYLPSSGQIQARVISILPAPPGMSSKHYLDYPLVGKLLPGDVDFLTDFQRDQLKGDMKENRKRFFDLKNGTSRRSYFAKPVATEFTKIINIASLTDHHLYGIHGSMVSLALGSIDNTLRFTQGSRGVDEAIGEILDHPILKHKVKLHVIDALRVQFASGPRQEAEFIRPTGIILLSRDPVAIDTIGVEIINRYRKAARISNVSSMTGHILSAAMIGLGEADRSKIEIRR